jgi:NodT family efflux transporter outer membrane factor (OMF) lipoprotein
MSYRSLTFTLCCITAIGCSGTHLAPKKHEDLSSHLAPTYNRSLPENKHERIITRPEAWWKHFNSPELSHLIEKAFNSNTTITVAWNRLAQSRALSRSENANAWPQADINFQRSYQRVKNKNTTQGDNNYTTGLNLSFEIDLWGKIAVSRKAATAEVHASEQDIKATALLISSEIAQNWIDILALREKITHLKGQQKVAEQLLSRIELRHRNGLATASELYKQRQENASIQTLIPQAHKEEELLLQKLALLLGDPPQNIPTIYTQKLPDHVTLPPLDIPSDLLTHRPDIASAWHTLQAQEFYLVSARANRLPTLTLSGTSRTEATHIANLCDEWAHNIIGGLTAPLFNAGAQKAEVERMKATVEESIQNYKAIVYNALREVESSLTQEQYHHTFLTKCKEQLTYAHTAYMQTEYRYMHAATEYDALLTAYNNYLVLKNEVIDAQADKIRNRIDLMVALGGNCPITKGDISL